MSKRFLMSDLADKFLEVEHKYKLLEMRLKNGLVFWDVVRYYTFIHLLELNDSYVVPRKTRKKRSFYKIVKSVFNVLFNEIFFMCSSRECDIVFYCSSRNIGKKNEPQDVVLMDCIDSLDCSKYFIESTIHPKYEGLSKFKNRYFLYTLNLLYKRKNKVEIEPEFEEVANILKKEFGFQTNWQELFKKLLFSFYQETIIYSRVFKKKRPKALIFISNNLPKALVYVCKNLGIYTIEMQHGALTGAAISDRYHPSVKDLSLPTVHDAYLTFSQYWNKRISSVFNVLAVGNTFYHFENKKRDENKVYTFISGKFIFPVLFSYAKSFAKACPDKMFYYKLHTSEIDHDQYARSESSSYPNLKIIYSEKNVNQLYEESAGVILIQSTCAYEALQSGLDVFIVKELYYKESMELFSLANVFLIESVEDFKNTIQNKQLLNQNKGDIPEFFTRFNKTHFLNFLKSVPGLDL